MSERIHAIHSMTGYARLTRATPLGEVTFSLRSVNHRTLDLHFYLPAALEPFEPALRTVMKRKLVRGHVDLRVTVEKGAAAGASSLNRELLDRYAAAYRELAALYGSDAPLDISALLRLPGAFLDEPAPRDPDQDAEPALTAALSDACDELNRFRAREGEELRNEIRRYHDQIAGAGIRLEDLRVSASAALRARLEERLAEMRIQLDPQRLAQEAAILVDRSEIAEEIARLRIHTRELFDLLQQGGECGKKIDFLLQEMGRETNTILSKTGNAGEAGLEITSLGLAIKAALEKIREQALNLE
jgi:uncharacterized protein (TIGR00255 family)